MRSLAAAQAEQQKNREAESAHVRRTVWGDSGAATSEADPGEDDMANTILGDVTHPAPIIMPPQQSNPVATAALMLMGLAAGSAAGGAAGYLLANNKEAPKTKPASLEDSTVSIGLGRVEDYLDDPQGVIGKP